MAKVRYGLHEGLTPTVGKSPSDVPWYVAESLVSEDFFVPMDRWGGLSQMGRIFSSPEELDEEIARLEAAGEHTKEARRARNDLAEIQQNQREQRERRN